MSMLGHRHEFDRELEAIEAKVIELFAMVVEDLPGEPQALLSGTSEVLPVLAEREQVIEALCSQIEELATRQILLQAPLACDLRFLLSVLRIAPDLDRCHHLVVDIAARVSHMLGEDLSPDTWGLTERMGAVASDMWRRAADAWYQRDRSTAAWLRERDDEMHELYASLTAELASGRMPLPLTIEMTLVGRSYESLGDHAVDIARRVIYLAGSASRQLSPLSGHGSGVRLSDLVNLCALPAWTRSVISPVAETSLPYFDPESVVLEQHEAQGADQIITSAVDAPVTSEQTRRGDDEDGPAGVLVPAG